MIEIILEITLCLFVFFALYKALLEKTAMHRFKRFYLLFCLVFSAIIPFLHFETENKLVSQFASVEVMTETVIEVFTPAEPVILESATSSPFIREIPVNEVKESGNHLPTILISLYGLVTLILLVRYANGVFQIIKKAKKGQRLKHSRAIIILLQEDIVPHNFMNYIFMNQNDYSNEGFRKKLLAHELGHASQKHSVDILFIELLKVFFWFNPLYYFYGKAIRQNHEYLADQMVIKSFGDVTAYQKLLLGFVKRTNQMELSLVSPSNYSLTKQRFEMMKRKLSKKSVLLKTAVLLPIIGLVSFSFLTKSKTTEVINERSEGIVDKIEQVINDPKPDISPIDPERYDFTIYTGFSPGRKPQFTSFIDSVMGTEYIGLPQTPIRTTAQGQVIEIVEGHEAFGKYIKIRHNETYETLYAKLDHIYVALNQTLVKGEIIGGIGYPEDLFGRIHYKVLKNGKSVRLSLPTKPDPRRAASFSNMSMTLMKHLDQNETEMTRTYGLDINYFEKNFSSGLGFKKIAYDRSRVVFTKHSGDVIVKDSEALSTVQKTAILALEMAPMRHPNKRKVPSEVYERWGNPRVYKIWIDGILTPNSEMSKYQASDFGHSSWVVVGEATRELNKHAFELWLQTDEYYNQAKQKSNELQKAWRKETTDLMKQIGSI